MNERRRLFVFIAGFCFVLCGCAAIPCGFGFFDVNGQCI